MCGVSRMGRGVRKEEVRRRAGVMKSWLSRAECVEVVWTHGENGGEPVGEQNFRI